MLPRALPTTELNLRITSSFRIAFLPRYSIVLDVYKRQALISRQEVGIEDLRNDIALLSQERTALLLSSGYPADYLETVSYTHLDVYKRQV